MQVWQCARPNPDSDCPAAKPNLGTACAAEGKVCHYEYVARCGGGDTTRACQNGIWVSAPALPCRDCASPETPIATPEGERPIASLQVGDLVYSVDHDAVVAVPLMRVDRNAVARHRVVRVVLADGRALEVSAGHPTADGRRFGDLKAGTAIDEVHSVVSAAFVPYAYDATYDILPASSTGTYYAAGALIGSTLFAPAPR